MNTLVDILSVLMIVGGLFFYLVGVIGLFRMPDVFTRMHATTKCDTLGAGMVFVGLIIWQGFTLVSIELLVILALIWLTTPTAAHYIANAEYERQEAKEGSVE
ncbi:MAG: monovalent cation/H(+) antiporter subunit G [Bacillota bacterium]